MKTFDLDTQAELDVKTGSSSQKDQAVILSEFILDQYDAARKTWAENAMKDDEFRNNRQWTEERAAELEGMAQFPIVVNVIHPAVEQAKAMLTANRPRFSSTGREDSDTKVGKLFADILTYIWDISTGNQQLKIAVDDYFVRGMGVMMAYADPRADMGKGEVFVTALDPFDVFFDPNAKDVFCRDSAHVVVAKTITAEQFQRAYPSYKWALREAVTKDDDRHPSANFISRQDQEIGTETRDGMSRRYELLDRYSKVNETMYHCYDETSGKEHFHNEQEYREYLAQKVAVLLVSGQEQIVTDPAGVQQVEQMYAQFGPIFHMMMNPITGQPEPVQGVAEADPNAIPNSQTVINFATIQDLVERGAVTCNPVTSTRVLRVFSLGGVKLWSGVLPLDEYPIIPLMNRHNRNPYPGSDVRIARPIQQYINKVRSLIMTHAANTTNLKVFIPRGGVDKKQLEAEWAKAGTAMIEYDPEIGVPIIASPNPLPNELYKNEADARGDIDQIFGIYALMQGDAQDAPNTYKGTIALDEYGQRRIKSKKDDVEGFLNQLAKVVVQLVQKTYTEKKVIRLVQPNDTPKELELNVPIYDQYTQEQIGRVNDVTVGKYDCIVVAGSMLPSNRWAQFEYYMTMYERGLIDQVEALKKSELVDVEGVLNRFSQIKAMQQQIAMLEQQLKQATGDLQTREREAFHANQRAEIESFKRKLHGVASDAKAAASLYESRLNDDLKQRRADEATEDSGAVAPGIDEEE